ncbi:uncharacterized protein LOC118195184 isoform X2 [Stegodyphus dumicola]|uniref:uncharacterized protein LOC118195184 isoform X2 n=1 Tax=Stegodyphus dumicola TaxID=202533 RepID=UPI0015B042C0|nr:uncharacterized protein LOC118195184 isoform X2 [Stegodyphus dumicola]
MITNSFDFVASATLLGPKAVKVPSMKKSNEKISTLEENIELAESELLKTIDDLAKEIEELSESMPISVASSSSSREEFSETVNHLNTVVKTGFSSKKTQNSVKSSVSKDIGSRRAQLKAAAFEQQATYYLRNISGKSDPDDQVDDQKNTDGKFPNSSKKAMRYKARVPKHLRKIGRPKNIPDQESDKKSESDSESNDESFLHLASDLLPSTYCCARSNIRK